MSDAFQRPDHGAAVANGRIADPNVDSTGDDGERPERVSTGGREPEIEPTVTAGERLAASVRRASTMVRSSVPLRTVAFVLPPLLLPFALGLPPLATVAVILLVAWVVIAAALLTTMMFDGSDQLALRAIERRLQERADAPVSSAPVSGAPVSSATATDALMAIGAQLDAISDRLDRLAEVSDRPRSTSDMHHRPQEQWPDSRGGDQNDRYDHGVEPERHWSPTRWQQ